MPTLLDRLRGEFGELQTQIREIDTELAEREEPATEAEQENLRALSDAMTALVPRIETESERAQRMHRGAELLNAVPADLQTQLDRTHARAITPEISTWGEFVRARANGEISREALVDYDRATLAMETAPRSAEDHQRAFVDQTTANLPGIVPPAFLKDILETVGVARPFIEAFSSIPLPDSGMTITYPTVTVRPAVAKQASQKTEIASRATEITATPTTVDTYGGGEDIAIQVLQRTDPAYLGIVMELYAEEMAAATDAAAIAAALAAITGPNELPLDGANPAGINASIIAGAKLVFANRAVPDTFVAGLDVWEVLAAAVDTDGRPIFPDANPSNPTGTASAASTTGTARGLRFVVDPNMPPDKAVLGWSRAFTSMLSGMGTLSVDSPSKLGVDYAVYEFAAFAVRRPGALVEYTLAPAVP